MSARLLFAGYFGCGNLGDDAILLGFLNELGPGYQTAVLSGNPEETRRTYGWAAWPRKDLKAVQEAISECDALVFPGGSLFQDVTSTRSVLYYHHLVKSAKKAGKKVLLLGQGVGPVNGLIGKRFTRDAFERADAIAVRDPASARALLQLGVKRKIHETGDSAFLLGKPPAQTDDQAFKVGDMRAVGVAPRPVDGADRKKLVQLFGDVCRGLYARRVMPTLIELDREEDGPFIEEIEKVIGGKVPTIRRCATPVQLQQRLARIDSILAVRLHAGILATTVDVPPFMIGYDPKVVALGQALGVPFIPEVRKVSAQQVVDGYFAFLEDRETHVRRVIEKREAQRELARLNVRVLTDLVPK